MTRPDLDTAKEEHVSVSNLRINLDDLLHARTVESERIEFKATWDPKVTGHQVLKTICAFANDLGRHGSGYVVLGVAEKDGRADLPPTGLTPEQMDEADRWITGRCRTMKPRYVPRISREERDRRRILVVWVPASETPPHRAPDGERGPRKYWVRVDDRTVDADAARLLTQLHAQSAVVSWDSRMATEATVDDISETKVREHLRACGSALSDESDAGHIYRKMDMVRRVNEHELPRNVALLFFSRDPSRWFPGAAIETSILQSGSAGDTFRDKTFKGGLAEQVRGCMDYLRREVIGSRIDKVPNQVSALSRSSYPEDALREVLVNAVFHRGYGDDAPHKTLVRVMPDRIDIRSTPGPVHGIDLDQLQRGATPRLVPPRNPRIGELFKEIGLAEKRLTGLGKVYQAMESNGSPPPQFFFDEQRTFFQATLFAHPWQSAESAIRKAGELRAVGRPDEARDALESAWRGDPTSHVLAEELIRELVAGGDLDRAEPMIEFALSVDVESRRPEVIVPWLEALVADGQGDRVRRFLDRATGRLTPHEAIGAAIVARRLRDSGMAARLFDVAGSAICQRDPTAGSPPRCWNAPRTRVLVAGRTGPPRRQIRSQPEATGRCAHSPGTPAAHGRLAEPEARLGLEGAGESPALAGRASFNGGRGICQRDPTGPGRNEVPEGVGTIHRRGRAGSRARGRAPVRRRASGVDRVRWRCWNGKAGVPRRTASPRTPPWTRSPWRSRIREAG